MRDILITVIIAGLIPVALFDPFVGVALWTWISVMNPHRLTWGFAYDFPFAMAVAIVTLLSLVLAVKKLSFPITAVTNTLLALMVWITVTLPFAIHFDASVVVWWSVTKTLVMTLVAIAVVRTERQIIIFLWIFVTSVAFFGVKGGVFAILTGGEFRVYGPPESQIADNNGISVALVMMFPLMWFLFHQNRNRLVRYGWLAAMFLSTGAVLASYSRGAFVAACAMVAALAIKTRHKALLLVLVVPVLPIIVASMPGKWWERMATIGAENVDQSVQGRYNAWQMAWNLALDRPIAGGGFAIYELDVFERYAPVPNDVHSAHNIYFQMLGEHGFVGLALYLLLAFFMWRTATRVIQLSTTDDTQWRANLAMALQVSMVGFLVGGLTVNIGYWDVYYFEMVLLIALARLSTKTSDAGGGAAHDSNHRPVITDTRPAAQG